MGFQYDFYNRLKQSKMFLANPQKNYIGIISGAEDIKITKAFSNMFEFEFTIYENKNGEVTDYYDKIIKHKLVEVQDIGWFQIITATETQDEEHLSTFKTVKCCQLENVLVYRKIYDIKGTFALYNPLDTNKSLLHIICAECGWNIGNVSNELYDIYRTFDIDSMQIYNLLTTEIMDSFDCVITFNTYTRSISARKLSEIGEDTNIIISRKNILKSWVKDDTDSMLITKIRVVGGDNGVGGNVDIRRVNFGSDTLINLDYFMNEEWCSSGLITNYKTYLSAKANASTTYNSTLQSLQTKQNELLTLNNALTDLIANQKAQSLVMGTCVDSFSPSRVPISSDTNYTVYQNALTLYNTYTSQIATKNTEISNKASEINSLNTTLSNIAGSVNISNYLTSDQIAEMNLFITEDEEFSDSTYIITDTMTDAEIIDMQKELMQNALNRLAIISHPQFVFTIKASNLFTLQDGKDSLISYNDFLEKFDVGNIITIKYKDNVYMQARLMKMVIPLNSTDPDIDLTFSSKSRLDDELIQLAEVLADAGRTANSFSLSKYGYNKASSQTSSVNSFMNDNFKGTLNAYQSNDDQEILIDEFGFHGRKWLADQNKYHDNQLWINNNGMLISTDGFATAKIGIGEFVNLSGEKFYGIQAPVIVGNFVLTSALTISNESNTITMNKDGAIFKDCDITITKGTSTLKLNSTDGIKLTNNSVSQFYIDGSGNASFAGAITGGTLNINNCFIVDSSGNCTANALTANGANIVNGTFSGTLSAGVSITSPVISGGTISGTTLTSTGTGGYTTTISQGQITTSYIVAGNTVITGNSVTVQGGGSTLTISPSSVGYYILDSNTTVTYINSSNYYEWCASSSHSHSEYATESWCNDTFEPLSGSDRRIKKNFKPLTELPDELYYSLLPQQYEFICDPYNNGYVFGLIAQDVIDAFTSFGLNVLDYNLIEIIKPRRGTDENLYVTDDKLYRINYSNFHTWNIHMIHKLNNRILLLEEKLGII